MSYQVPIMNWNEIERKMQCPNGHYDKIKLKENDIMYYWECNICKRRFWTPKTEKLMRSRGSR